MRFAAGTIVAGAGGRDGDSGVRRTGKRWAAAAAVLVGIWLIRRPLLVYDLSPDPCPMPTAQRSAAEPVPLSDAEIKILSYNIAGHLALPRGGHLEAVAELINREAPDVVGLQEVHRGTWQARFRDQAAELAAATGLTPHFAPSFRSLGGEFGNAILVRGRVLATETVPLPSIGEPRSLLKARLEVRGVEIDFFVTHLSSWGKVSRRTRAEQARCLAEHLRAAPGPFVLCGGLITEPTFPLLRQRIDYILAGPGWKILDAVVLPHGPSDHWPVAARLAAGRAAVEPVPATAAGTAGSR